MLKKTIKTIKTFIRYETTSLIKTTRVEGYTVTYWLFWIIPIYSQEKITLIR